MIRHSSELLRAFSFGLVLLALGCYTSTIASETDFDLVLRSRVPAAAGSAQFHMVHESKSWQAQETAIIVCDMWDAHHCLNAVRRGTELAPRMNRVLHAARDRGAIIIHAPSSCMDAYKTHPARVRALAVPRAEELPESIAEWCDQIAPELGGEYPIDQSDGGEDDNPQEHAAWAKALAARGLNPRSPWKAQMSNLDIVADADYISDEGEVIWSILAAENRPNVILLGVHTNMCVLGRPFGLRQLAKNGKNVVLMRDMTDTMYNPAMKPYVSHFTGTDLIVEHIEKWVCPTITSDQIVGGTEFRFRADRRPHLAIVTAEREYKTEESLPKFAREQLGHSFRISVVHADAENRNTLPGIDVLDDADILLLSVRRRLLPEQQMSAVRRFVESGKPIVGIRTANHAFSLRNEAATNGLLDWRNWDAQIIGGSYTNHHGEGPDTQIQRATQHPILTDVDLKALKGKGSLYVVSPLRETATALLTGQVEGKPTEPVAWTNVTEFGNRVFYTSLGHPDDFKQPAFQRLLKNALHWAAGLDICRKDMR